MPSDQVSGAIISRSLANLVTSSPLGNWVALVHATMILGRTLMFLSPCAALLKWFGNVFAFISIVFISMSMRGTTPMVLARGVAIGTTFLGPLRRMLLRLSHNDRFGKSNAG